MNLSFLSKIKFSSSSPYGKNPGPNPYWVWGLVLITSSLLFVVGIGAHAYIFISAGNGSLFGSDSGLGVNSKGLNRAEIRSAVEKLDLREKERARLRLSPATISSFGTPPSGK